MRRSGMGLLTAAVAVLAVALGLGAVSAGASAGQLGAGDALVASSTTSPGADAAEGVYPGGGVAAYGDAVPFNPLAGLTLNAPVVAMVAVPTPHGSGGSGSGFWLASADGGVYAVDGAPYYGSAGSLSLNAPIVALAATPDGKGYWLAALDGGVFAFGDAGYFGSMGGQPLNQPVVGMAAAPTGGGYWLVAADGGIFAFGSAGFHGSTGSMSLVAPISGMAAAPTGGGYWLVALDGGVFAFGTASYEGSLGATTTLPTGIVAIAPSANALGYWLLGWNGAVWGEGDAQVYGMPVTTPAASPYVSLVPTPDGKGYWLLEPDGFHYSFDNPPPVGGDPAVVSAAASQIGPDPDTTTGTYCNPYGPCEQWCALFATWVWQHAGIPVPSYAFTGDIYTWASRVTAVLAPTDRPAPGDAVLYGTGPWTAASSVHVGIVAQVWPDGAIDTVEGDAGPGADGHLAVIVNGPFLPSDSLEYNGVGIYAYAVP